MQEGSPRYKTTAMTKHQANTLTHPHSVVTILREARRTRRWQRLARLGRRFLHQCTAHTGIEARTPVIGGDLDAIGDHLPGKSDVVLGHARRDSAIDGDGAVGEVDDGYGW